MTGKSPDKSSENFSDKISDSVQNKQTKEFYEFSSFRLDAKKRRLLRGDDIIPLTPKEFEVLLLLVENAGRVVEKDELLDAVWKDTFVEEGTLTRNISWLRKKLADGGDAKVIETLPKRGYRFLPEITEKPETEIAVVEQFPEQSALVVETQTIQQIEIEESIEILPSSSDNEIVFADGKFHETPKIKALPAAPAKRRISPLWIIPILLICAALAFFAYRGFFAKNQSNVILTSKIIPFSGLPGREDSPDFSPDGKQMVFAWDGGIENGNSDIYIKLIGAGEPVRLTDTETDEINPVFSPDGKSIAFVRVYPTHNEIILIPALGGAERKIYEHASYASLSFSPDGVFIAHADLNLAQNNVGIFTINLQTGEKKRLTTPAAPAVDHTPRFSPDGKNLAFIRYFSSFKREIFVVPTSGGEPYQVTSDDVRIYGLAWNIGSKNLYFTSFRTLQQLNLWQIPADGGEPKLIPTGSKDLQSLAISPDGKTLAFVEETADENIWEINANDQKIAPKPLIRSTRADHSQQFSPNGANIVFASDRTGNYEIWISDADGKNQRQLTDGNGSAGSPRFSPDGKYIAYDAQTAGNSDLYIVSVNGGASVRLTNDKNSNSLPAWSADGNWIFFLSNRSGSNQIWKMSAKGGEAAQITKRGAFEMFAAPDGKTAIYSKGAGKVGLWSVGTDGNDENPIPELAVAAAWRSWTVAANGVYYTTFAAQPPFHIEFFDFATRRKKEIVTVEKPPLSYYSDLSVSPDGKTILYSQQDQSASSIMLAELN